MIKYHFASIFFMIVCLSCNQNKKLEGEEVKKTSSPMVVETRREYWPLDHDIFNEDTTFQQNGAYQIHTKNYSLNDSAVVSTAIDDIGKILQISHNRVAEVTILKDQKPYIKTNLTKNIFQENEELVLTGTSFLKYENNEFIFKVDACIPDTDVCDEAEIAINQDGKIRVIRFLEQEPSE